MKAEILAYSLAHTLQSDEGSDEYAVYPIEVDDFLVMREWNQTLLQVAHNYVVSLNLKVAIPAKGV